MTEQSVDSVCTEDLYHVVAISEDADEVASARAEIERREANADALVALVRADNARRKAARNDRAERTP
jgi:hypothetical protein